MRTTFEHLANMLESVAEHTQLETAQFPEHTATDPNTHLNIYHIHHNSEIVSFSQEPVSQT